MFRIISVLLTFGLLLTGCDALQYQALKTYMSVEKGLRTDDGADIVNSAEQTFSIRALTDELEFPWGFDFLPDGQLIVTERPGRVSILNPQTGSVQPVAGAPEVYYKGQGGLLDVAVHPRFEETGWIYLSAAVPLSDKERTTRVTRYRLSSNALTEPKTILEATPAGTSNNHFGSALLFDNNGYLYVTVGDRKQRQLSQDLGSAMGKVFRLHDDGTIPQDNPFVHTPNALPGIFTYGHRNPQGITTDRSSGRIWVAEHGPQGGDEINLLQAGANYGWPIITYGEEYGGGKIGEGTAKAGMQQPLHYYVPSIGTGGLAYYSGTGLPGWNDSLFVAGLRSFSVSRVPLNGAQAEDEERLLASYSFRARNLKQGPDGNLYLLTENGGILRLTSAE